MKHRIYIFGGVYMLKRTANIINFSSMILPLIVSFIMLFLLPDIIPAHMTANGVIDRYGSKMEIFIAPAANILILIFFKIFFKVLFIVIGDSAGVKIAEKNVSLNIFSISLIVVSLLFCVLCLWYFSWLYITVL